MIMPSIFSILKTHKEPTRKGKPKEYIEAIFTPLLVPIYGLKAIFRPSNEMDEKHWHLKVSFDEIVAL